MEVFEKPFSKSLPVVEERLGRLKTGVFQRGPNNELFLGISECTIKMWDATLILLSFLNLSKSY
jgi:hypothetical protein